MFLEKEIGMSDHIKQKLLQIYPNGEVTLVYFAGTINSSDSIFKDHIFGEFSGRVQSIYDKKASHPDRVKLNQSIHVQYKLDEAYGPDQIKLCFLNGTQKSKNSIFEEIKTGRQFTGRAIDVIAKGKVNKNA